MPEVAAIGQVMREHGTLGCRMTGSGSAVFGLFDNEEAARRCAAALRRDYDEVFQCRPCPSRAAIGSPGGRRAPAFRARANRRRHPHFIGEGRPRTGTPNSGGSQTLLSRFLSPPISPTFRGYAALRRRVLPKTRIAAPSPGYGGVNPLFSLLAACGKTGSSRSSFFDAAFLTDRGGASLPTFFAALQQTRRIRDICGRRVFSHGFGRDVYEKKFSPAAVPMPGSRYRGTPGVLRGCGKGRHLKR